MREVMETYKPHILSRRRHLIEDCIRDLRLNNDHIHIIEQEMRRCIQQGLSKTGHESSSVKCFPTYVRKLPNGKENGKFLSLDLGGKSIIKYCVKVQKNILCLLFALIFLIDSLISFKVQIFVLLLWS